MRDNKKIISNTFPERVLKLSLYNRNGGADFGSHLKQIWKRLSHSFSSILVGRSFVILLHSFIVLVFLVACFPARNSWILKWNKLIILENISTASLFCCIKKKSWRCGGLNSGLLTSEASTLPLSYNPNCSNNIKFG